MMRKHVYGKKSARSAFAVSDIFTEPSPSKLANKTRATHEPDDILAKASRQLEELQISGSDSDQLPTRRERRPLSRRDGNSRPTSKHGDIKKKSASKRSEKAAQAHSEIATSRKRSEKEVEPVEIPSVELPASLYELCDAYIQPLVALTNEQRMPLAFETWSDALIPHFSISKIAEASYSEVYRLSLLQDHPTLTTSDESVLKLVALKPEPVDGQSKKTKAQVSREENMSSVEDVVSEVRLLKRMTEVPGFTNYRALHILKGRPSKPFVQAWKEWNKVRRKGEKSEFPDPSRKANYDEDQYWAVIEMQDAGTDVEKLIEDEVKSKNTPAGDASIRSIWSAWDIFWQTVLAVAKGESEARFEHRDLHLGNICVRRIDAGCTKGLVGDVLDRKLRFTNLETTIIDYTLSRAELAVVSARPTSSHSSSSDSSTQSGLSAQSVDPEIAYNPLEKQPQIFEGDAKVEYQYDIYRYMRTVMVPDSEVPDWRAYRPKTNLIWLHFVLSKLGESMHWPSDDAPKKKDKRVKKALELEQILVQVEDLLSIQRLLGEEECVLVSAAELVAIALEQGWLDPEDINS